MNLQYRGYMSTRLQLAIAIVLAAIILLTQGMITSDNWVELVKWSFLTYAGSEGIAKGAEAYKDKA